MKAAPLLFLAAALAACGAEPSSGDALVSIVMQGQGDGSNCSEMGRQKLFEQGPNGEGIELRLEIDAIINGNPGRTVGGCAGYSIEPDNTFKMTCSVPVATNATLRLVYLYLYQVNPPERMTLVFYELAGKDLVGGMTTPADFTLATPVLDCVAACAPPLDEVACDACKMTFDADGDLDGNLQEICCDSDPLDPNVTCPMP